MLASGVIFCSFIVFRLLIRSLFMWLAAADSLALGYAIKRVDLIQQWLQLNVNN
jgi:hypothetical protein